MGKNGRKDSDDTSKPRLTGSMGLYMSAAQVLMQVDAKKGHLKNLVYSRNDKNKGQLLALITKTLQKRPIIKEILIKADFLNNIKMDPQLKQIIMTEILFGNGNIVTYDETINEMQNHKSKLEEILKRLNVTETSDDELTKLPCYVRVNSLLCTVEKCIHSLLIDGFKQIFYSKKISFTDFIEKVKLLQQKQFMVDYHFPDVLVFNPKEQLFKSSMLQNGYILISDKASYIPPYLLAPPADSKVIDACAAPGYKTIHLAAKMANTGKIFAFDMNLERCQLLKENLNFYGVQNCNARHFDFLHINTNLPSYEDVEYALVDPSCSGSGMVSRMSHLLNEEKISKERLNKISNFQVAILQRALRFPNIKRVVYSTCSVHVEENEAVVAKALNGFENTFKVVNVLPQWPQRGDNQFEFGPCCIRTIPEKHLTNGFFVAVIERIGWPINDSVLLQPVCKKSKKRKHENKPKMMTKLPKFNVSPL